MAEEIETIDEETAGPFEEASGSGPGFILGVMVGALAGAAAATLFTPATGEEFRHTISQEAGPLLKHQGDDAESGSEPTSAVSRVRAILTRVRSRVQEASEQAQGAAEESEAASRARYAQLVDQEQSEQ